MAGDDCIPDLDPYGCYRQLWPNCCPQSQHYERQLNDEKPAIEDVPPDRLVWVGSSNCERLQKGEQLVDHAILRFWFPLFSPELRRVAQAGQGVSARVAIRCQARVDF